MKTITLQVSDHVDNQTTQQIQNFFNGLSDAEKRRVGSNKDSFSYWLNKRAPYIYRKVANYIDEIWSQIEEALADIIKGVAIGAATVVAVPVVGAAVIAKGIWKWLND